MTSVYPITFMPPNAINMEKIAIPYIHTVKLMLEIAETANAPRYRMEVRLTTTYSSNQKTAIMVLTVPLYRTFRNCGMVSILFFRYTGMKNTATIISVAAASHS